MQPKETLIVAAAHLAKSSPTSWQNFMAALGVHVDLHRKQLLTSPTQDLQVNQGRAQSLAALFDDLTTCSSVADKIAQKGK